MIFKGEKTFFFRSIFWIVFFINLSLSSLFEANGQDRIIWEKYKIEKSKEDPLDSKLKKQDSNFESNGLPFEFKFTFSGSLTGKFSFGIVLTCPCSS